MRVQSPIAGNMAGAAGGLIFQHYNGRTYARAFPVIFHYQPTPAQKAAQDAYYSTRSLWLPVYNEIKPFIPLREHKQCNVYSSLTKGVYNALGVFHEHHHDVVHEKIGFDVYDRIRIYQGNITATYQNPYYYLHIHGFDWVSKVIFEPKIVHVLYFCMELGQMQYDRLQYVSKDLVIPFRDVNNWLTRYSVHIYIALSDDDYFSDFFY